MKKSAASLLTAIALMGAGMFGQPAFALGSSSLSGFSDTVTDNRDETATPSNNTKKAQEGLELYASFDLEEAIAQDPEGFTYRHQALEASPAWNEYFNTYSIDPIEDRARLAATLPNAAVDQLVDKADGKKLVLNPETGNLDLVDREDQANEFPMLQTYSNDPCWKSWVGTAAYTIVTGMACGALGPIAGPLCMLGTAGGGLYVDWNVDC